MTFLETSFYGNDVRAWVFAAGIGIVAYIILRLFIRHVLRFVSRVTERTETDLDDLVVGLLAHTRSFLIGVLALYSGSLALELPLSVTWAASRVAVLALFLQLALWGSEAIQFSFTRYFRTSGEGTGRTGIAVLRTFSQVALWSIIVVLALDNLGFQINAIVTSLGISGVAMALAVQNILGDLFASLAIVLDEPFRIGDSIQFGDFSGSVEQIGLKTTRVRSVTGEELVVSNADLLGSRIRNYGRLSERRLTFQVGVTYDTPGETLAMIPEMIREVIESQGSTRFARSHLKELGDSALYFESVYYMTVPDYTTYMDTQQAINLELFARFSRENIQFAYPTQTLFVSKIPGDITPSMT